MPVLRTRRAAVRSALFSLSIMATAAGAVDVHDTRMLSQPAVSSRHVAFVYADDLWIAERGSGGETGPARRLTAHLGVESRPRFSPDGRFLAFSGEYDGNTDVYLVSVDGGEPRRLTWHPHEDRVQDFTPDGSAVLFTSSRHVYTRRYTQLFTVPFTPEGEVAGGPVQLPIPHAFKAAYSPDGSKIAYVPLSEPFLQWKNYRGGTASRIWIYDVATHEVEQVPQPAGRSNDTDPMWVGGELYFRSDRAGEFNLFLYPGGGAEPRQLTRHEDFPVLEASASAGDPGVIAYEQAGYVHLFDPAAGSSQRLTIAVAADLPEARPRWVSDDEYARTWDISPSGARAVFGYRGEIVTVPAEKGDPRNLTQSPDAHERSPAWSPDGRSIAYFSDASGEYELHVAPQDGRGEVRRFALGPKGGAGHYQLLRWAPDGERLSFVDNSWSLFVIELASGKVEKISSEYIYGPQLTLSHAWSPDSRWLAYTRNTPSYIQRLYLYSVDEGRSHAVTEGLSDVSEPVFDAGGKYLYFFASTDSGPVRQWFAMSNADMEESRHLYLAVLPKGELSPLARQSDEEKGSESEEAGSSKDGKDGKDGKNGNGEKKPPRVTVDFERLEQRIVTLPVPAGIYSNLQAGPAGKIYYQRSATAAGLFGEATGTSLRLFDLEKREEETLADGLRSYQLSADGKKLLIQRRDGWQIADAGAKVDPAKGKLATNAIHVEIEPRTEWAQIYDEVWRINRDYFYDPGMHGADWPAMKEKYAVFLPHLASRRDLNRLIQWLCSELAVGHHRVFGGDYLYDPEEVPGGLLGADYEIHEGRYRFARVYGGLNWNPDLRSPLTEPGVGVKAGEYLLAVDGRDLRPPENLYSRFEHTAGKTVELTVGPNPSGAGSRRVKVVPIEDESGLRNRAWVEGNLKKVEEATDGRVAYVYVPNTTQQGHEYFKRYFYPQTHKEAIIVDERHNGGGQVADYYIDLLRRPLISYWHMRYGAELRTPQASIQGPKVMLIDETAGSGGDLLPWMFRKLGLGKLIGRPTWGGLVGILGFPELMDGGLVMAPNLAIWTEDGFIVENVGVPPDIEVEQLPKLVIEGRDPQLERAIEEILKELEANPPPKMPERPPFPVRVRS